MTTLLENMSEELARVFVLRNEITGAFVWPEGGKWIVYIGDHEKLTGWMEAEFKRKKDAQDYCDKLKALINRLREGDCVTK